MREKVHQQQWWLRIIRNVLGLFTRTFRLFSKFIKPPWDVQKTDSWETSFKHITDSQTLHDKNHSNATLFNLKNMHDVHHKSWTQRETMLSSLFDCACLCLCMSCFCALAKKNLKERETHVQIILHCCVHHHQICEESSQIRNCSLHHALKHIHESLTQCVL